MLTRRSFLKMAGVTVFGGLALGGYAFGAEPFRLRVQNYRLTPPDWPDGLRLRIAALADIHACSPWMTPVHIRRVVERTNGLAPDITFLLGDFCTTQHLVADRVEAREWAGELAGLSAPLGVHAILGNHDWWDDPEAQARGHGPVRARIALEDSGIPVYENEVSRIEKDGHPFWIAGLGDQIAFRSRAGSGRGGTRGTDDLPGTLRKISDDAPVILLAHEPDIFPSVPERVSLTLSGHTHGGQVRLFGYSPVVPSRYGERYAYGHIRERRGAIAGTPALRPRDLIVSGGLGCSILPVRLGMPPEIVVVDLG
jgi:predicted MPP superfamily phosphohydrolase